MKMKSIKSFSNILERLTYSIKRRRHKLAGNPRLWEMKRQFQIDFLLDQNLNPSDTFLDIGCGTLRGGIPIIRYLNKGNYFGIDVRKKVIEEARKELKEENLEYKKPNLILFRDFNSIKIEIKFNVILAFSVLFHMEDRIAEDCFHFIKNHLQSEGNFFANVKVNKHSHDGSWQGFPIISKPLDFYKELAKKTGLEMTYMNTLKNLGHNSGSTMRDNHVMLKIKNSPIPLNLKSGI